MTNGDNVTTIASSIRDAINAVPALPFYCFIFGRRGHTDRAS
ncbi:hypothetical protein ACP0HM_12265 [Escherichia coli]